MKSGPIRWRAYVPCFCIVSQANLFKLAWKTPKPTTILDSENMEQQSFFASIPDAVNVCHLVFSRQNCWLLAECQAKPSQAKRNASNIAVIAITHNSL